MSAEPDALYIEKLQKRVREIKAELSQSPSQPAPPAEIAQPALQPIIEEAAPKPKKEGNAWAKAVKRYQELEKARGRSITLKEAMRELSEFKKSTA